jgi:hypothetical protein
MSRYRGQFHPFLVRCSRPLLGVAMMFVFAACDKNPELPGPPHSPPKPVTSMQGSYISTAHFDMPGRIVAPPPGWM